MLDRDFLPGDPDFRLRDLLCTTSLSSLGRKGLVMIAVGGLIIGLATAPVKFDPDTGLTPAFAFADDDDDDDDDGDDGGGGGDDDGDDDDDDDDGDDGDDGDDDDGDDGDDDDGDDEEDEGEEDDDEEDDEEDGEDEKDDDGKESADSHDDDDEEEEKNDDDGGIEVSVDGDDGQVDEIRGRVADLLERLGITSFDEVEVHVEDDGSLEIQVEDANGKRDLDVEVVRADIGGVSYSVRSADAAGNEIVTEVRVGETEQAPRSVESVVSAGQTALTPEQEAAALDNRFSAPPQ